MKIKNIHDLAAHFGTTALGLESTLSNRARADIHVDKFPTYVRVGSFVGECNAEFCILCTYPFESSAVDTFIEKAEMLRSEAYSTAFDDPIEMLMHMTDPGQVTTLEDAGEIMSEAEAYGWRLDPQLTPEDILAICNDIDYEEDE